MSLSRRQQRLQAERAEKQTVLVAMRTDGTRQVKLVPEREALQAAARLVKAGKVWTLWLGGTAWGPSSESWTWKRERPAHMP